MWFTITLMKNSSNTISAHFKIIHLPWAEPIASKRARSPSIIIIIPMSILFPILFCHEWFQTLFYLQCDPFAY